VFRHNDHLQGTVINLQEIVDNQKLEIEGLNNHKERLKNIINKMTYGLYVSDPMDALEEIKQGNFEISETMVVEFLDLENIK